MKTASASHPDQLPILTAVAKAIRTQRLLRGCLLICIVALGALAVAFLLNLTVGISDAAIGWWLAAWAVVFLGSVVIGLAVPWMRRITPQALAGKIEHAYPNLAERLSTAANLSNDAAHGSVSLQQVLRQQLRGETNAVALNKIVDGGRLTPWFCGAATLLLAFVVGLSTSPSFRHFTGRFFFLANDVSPTTVGPIVRSEPVRLQSAYLLVKPPAYLNAQVHASTRTKLPGAALAIEYGALQIELAADRPFRSARLEFASQDGGVRHTLPIPSQEKSKKKIVNLPKLDAGQYRLFVVFESKHGVSSKAALGALTIQSDAEPAFTPTNRFGVVHSADAGSSKLSQSKEIPSLSPDEYLPITVAVEDREGVEQVELQFHVNDGPRQSQLLAVGDGSLVVSGSVHWPMKNLAKNGDIVRYRIMAFDNRRVPAELFTDVMGRRVPVANLTPHVIFDPPVNKTEQWYVLQINADAESFQRQNLVAQQDWLTKQLNALRQALRKEQVDLQKVRDKSQPGKTTDGEKAKLAAIEKAHAKTQEKLAKIAKGIEQTWPLEQIGKESRDVVDKELKPSGGVLKSIPKEDDDKNRLNKFATVDSHLSRAQERLAKLADKADQLTKNYLDQMDLADLAAKEEKLANKAGELAKENPTEDASKQKLAELKNEQDKVKKKVDAMADKSQLVKKAISSAQGKQLQILAKQAEGLALKQQEMNAKLAQSSAKAVASKLEKIIREQKVIVSDSLKQRDSADDKQLAVEPGNDAVINLESRLLKIAMEDQLQFGRNLEAWANRLAPGLRTTTNAADARTLAKQQSQVLTDLVRFSREFVKYPVPEFDKKIAEIKSQQSEVRKQMDAMWVSLVKSGSKSLLDKARNGLSHATMLMDRNQFLRAKQHMEIGIGALNEIAKTAEIEPLKQQVLPENATAKEKQAWSVHTLASRQFALRNETAKLLQSLSQQDVAEAQRLKQQLKQQKAAAKLQKELEHMAQHTKVPDIKKSLTDAAKMTQGAEKAMKKVEDGVRKKDPATAKKSGADAVDLLKKTSSLANKTATKMMVASKKSKADEAGMAFKQGQDQLKEAKEQLEKGNIRQAQSAMKNAAQALKSAALKSLPRMAKSSKPGQPNQAGKKPNPKMGNPNGPLTTGVLPDPRLAKDAKTWGQLDGKLPTELVQVMRARYGADYAQIIQRYFQQIADVPIEDRKKDK